MRNNNNAMRGGANGSKRSSTSSKRVSSTREKRGTKQEKPVRKKSYSAEEGSVKEFRTNKFNSKSKRNDKFKTSNPDNAKRRRDDKFENKRNRTDRFENEKPKRFKSDNNRFENDKPKRFSKSNHFEQKEKRFEQKEGRSFEERERRPMRPKALSYTPKPRQPKGNGEEGVRLNKYIANSGICSRREADEYIVAGLVSVNGVIITELGTKVYNNDVVKFNNERIKGEEKVYILMNKPKDYVTTISDPHAEKTVINLIEGKCSERVFPVGRLDKATTGVLLLTNDGDLAEKLTHPSFEKKKIYHVFLNQNFKTPDFNKLLEGIHLEDGFIQADALSYIDEDKSQIGIEIHSGRNRIVRRVFEHLGYKIKKLDRVYFAGLTKKNLRRGQWRFLTNQEISMLKMGSFE